MNDQPAVCPTWTITNTARIVYHPCYMCHIYKIHIGFLLLRAGDVETNPGPECPCGATKNTLFIKCSECDTSWHVDCVGLKEITDYLLKKLNSWKCAVCIILPQNIQQVLSQKLCPIDVKSIFTKMSEMEDRLNSKIENIKEAVKPSYSNVFQQDKLQAKVNSTNRLVKSLAQQKEPTEDSEETKQRKERTIIVKKYMDPKVRNSPDIRQPLYDEYPGIVIRNARTTVGGSLLVELDNKETVERVKNNWNKNLYGGNDGAVDIKNNPPAGIVKNISRKVLDEFTSEEDLINEIKSSYPDVKVDLFKRNDKFTGTLKIEFNTEEEYQRAVNDRVKIFYQKYIMERYEYKPRVIICKYCQMFNHVSRVCRNRLKGKPRCGKCSSNDHETKDCIIEKEDYKCCHCEGNHETGAKECEVVKTKLDAINERAHNG